MAGKSPTHNIMVPVEFGKPGEKGKTKWYKIGSGWMNAKGHLGISIVTMPNVKMFAFPTRPGDFEEGEVMKDKEGRDIDLGEE